MSRKEEDLLGTAIAAKLRVEASGTADKLARIFLVDRVVASRFLLALSAHFQRQSYSPGINREAAEDIATDLAGLAARVETFDDLWVADWVKEEQDDG